MTDNEKMTKMLVKYSSWMTEQDAQAIIKCYQSINDYTPELETIINDIDNDYMSVDHKGYAWYLYGSTEAAVRVSDLYVLTAEEIKNTLGDGE